MLFHIKSYLKFLSKSTNQHGVHSPFVFNLVTKCFYSKTDSQKNVIINQYRNQLVNNNSIISVTDFGKGSKIFKSNERKVSKIAKIAGISKKRSKLLIRIVSHFKSTEILEIGTSLGIGSASLALGNLNAQITTLEGCTNTANIASKQFKKFDFNSIYISTGDFKNTLSKSVENKSYDLIYFDGNHQKEATIDYFEQCLKTIHNETVFIFDDIHWSTEMLKAWEYIKNHNQVTVTIDTYFWGIVFFRKEQTKQHFVIRI